MPVTPAELTRLKWRKSLRSGNGGANCVEVAAFGAGIAVRDSKSPGCGALAFTPAEWNAFTERVRNDRYRLD